MNETECIRQEYLFQPLKSRAVVGRFDGGTLTSDAGLLLVREVALRSKVLSRFSECFVDHRNPDFIRHTVEELVSQRVYGIVCGYEDLNDHDQLRNDQLFSALVGKKGEEQGAGKSTLNRLELTRQDANKRERYKKVVCDSEQIERLFVDIFLKNQERKPKLVILDLDATDYPLYGKQEGRFFHGYYGE